MERHCSSSDFCPDDKHGRRFTEGLDSQQAWLVDDVRHASHYIITCPSYRLRNFKCRVLSLWCGRLMFSSHD